MMENRKNWLQRLLDGYSWLGGSIWMRTAFLVLCALLTVPVGWHTDQSLCLLAGTGHLWGLPYLMIGALGVLTLLHEADHVWKYRWVKVPVGILSAWFLFYSGLDLLWLTAQLLLGLSAQVTAWGCLLSAAASAVLVGVGWRNAGRVRRVRYRIRLDSLDSQLQLVLLSDLHLGAYVGEAHLRRIVEAVNAAEPELIIIAGDLIDGDNSVLSEPEELSRLAGALRGLQSKYGTFLSLGNHDPKAEDPAFLAFLEESQIRLLHNQVLKLPSVNVIGISDPTRNHRVPFEALMTQANPANPTVVADHDPRCADSAVAHHADMVLSGHTHGGQFFPASFFTRIVLGKRRFYGHYEQGNTHTVVTSGAGFFNLPVRIGTFNEIVNITLIPK